MCKHTSGKSIVVAAGPISTILLQGLSRTNAITGRFINRQLHFII